MKLVARVALASAMAAALGGTISAFSAGLTAKGLIAKQEKSSLQHAASELAEEVLDELDETEDDADEDAEEAAELAALQALASNPSKRLDWALAHELEDVELPGVRAAIFEHGVRVAGDALPAPAPGDCQIEDVAGTPMRVCAVPLGGKLLVLAARADAEQARKTLFSAALWIGLACGALLGGASSYALSRWALRPLTTLRDQVRAIPIDASDSKALAPAQQPELEELRASIASLVDRLGAALRQAQSFASEAAHELRTPLTTLGGELELMEQGPELGRVRVQVQQLTDLVQRLLVLAQANRLPDEQREVVDLSDVASEALALVSVPTRVHAQVQDDVIVRGDQALLRTLLLNALENALKFSQGPVALRIARAEEAQIEVDDDGPGIPAEERERVFQPFYRSPSVRAGATRGHGIGLSLIARVAWVHGGRAKFVDRPRGAALRVYLPLWRQA
ncbi:MAG TPA: HAMP domain-containing sensor histidine kinase [Polyangiales bacterium]|nr:HAMP domain-containing sensor histidine kinase [Polyangiales bacterium]